MIEENMAMQEQAAPARPQTEPKIYRAIAGVMRDVKPVAKDGINDQQRFKYRKIDDVYDALNRALVNNCVVIIPEIISWDKTETKTNKGTTLYFVQLKVKYTLFAEDGSNVSAIMMGEGMDSGDKAFNKAMTAAYKYLCFETFCIPIEDLQDDPDKESLEFEKDTKTRKQTRKAAPGVDRTHAATTAAQKPANQAVQPANQAVQPANQAVQPANQAVQPASQAQADPSKMKVTAIMVTTLQKEIARLGQKEDAFLKYFNVEKMEDLTIIQFRNAMAMFRKQDEKEKEKQKEETQVEHS